MDQPADELPSEKSSSSSGGMGWKKALRDVAPYLDLGWRLAGTAAGPPTLGMGVDLWLGTMPWMTLAGAGLGLASAALVLSRVYDDSL